MKEAGVVVSPDGSAVYWHLPENRTVGSLPDSRDLWDVFWENRHTMEGFAHSHPGSGIPAPSWEDLTTFAAVEAGLGVRLTWWITSSDTVISLEWTGPGKHDYSISIEPEVDAPWAPELREKSKAL